MTTEDKSIGDEQAGASASAGAEQTKDGVSVDAGV